MANTKISGLPSAASLTGVELLPAVQSGSTTQATVNQVKTYVNTSPAITGGSINSTPIGATTPSTGAFTSLSASVAGTASTVPLLIQSPTSDATIRFKTTSGTAGMNQFEIRSVGVAGYDGLQFRYVNDANTLFTQMALISPAGLAVTGNISSTARTLVGTTTDDGVNALQVNGSVKASGISTLNGLKVAAASGLPTLSIDNSTDTGNVDFATGGSVRFRIGYSGTSLVLSSPFSSKTIFTGDRDSGLLTVGNGLAVTGNISSSGTITPQQATTAGAPAYVKGAIYFDTTLNKLRVGGATAWETITSI